MAIEQSLSRGQRIKMADFGMGSQPFVVDLKVAVTGVTVDAACFGLDSGRKLSDERYMTFFNQPESPCGGVKQINSHNFRFALDLLPAAIDVVVLTLAIDGVGVLSSLGASQAKISSGAGVPVASFAFDGSFFKGERAVMLIEFYRKDGQWRMSPVGQGFNGGLDALVQHFGGAVATPAPVATPPAPPSITAPPVSLSKVTLTKPNQTHRISLVKDASAPRKITVKATWVDNGDGDDDNDDLDLRVGILLPSGKMSFIQAPERSGAFDASPYVRHLGDVTTTSMSAPGTEVVEVNPKIGQLLSGPVALVFSVYSAVANGAVSVGAMAPKMVMEYGNQVVECAFDFKNASVAQESNVYTYVIGVIEIDGDAIVLSPSGKTSAPDSEWTPWLTRSGNSVKVTLDGPAVFKGQMSGKADELNRHNPHRYS
ncbi:MAG: TerD family protein [Azonexus sp.]